jgi:2-oxo-4-hydroxy-4-carboxy--5-ureidoimidazoline (OHCU) decarboxylase
VSDDLAARNLGLVRDQRLKLLVADPRGDDVRRLLALLRRLEETERAEDAVAGLDQVVAREARQLLQLRDEGLVDLAGSARPCDSDPHRRSGE